MNKQEFLWELRRALAGLPQQDVEERLAFCSEMIDDRIEEGLTEREAVAAAGPIPEIVSQTLSEVPLTRLMRERVKPRRSLRGWELALLILGFPLWFPLLAAAAAVVLSLYAVLWALLVALWAVEAALIVSALACLAAGVILFLRGRGAEGLAALGAGLACAGLSILMVFFCAAASKGLVRLTKRAALGLKTLFLRKETEQ